MSLFHYVWHLTSFIVIPVSIYISKKFVTSAQYPHCPGYIKLASESDWPLPCSDCPTQDKIIPMLKTNCVIISDRLDIWAWVNLIYRMIWSWQELIWLSNKVDSIVGLCCLGSNWLAPIIHSWIYCFFSNFFVHFLSLY